MNWTTTRILLKGVLDRLGFQLVVAFNRHLADDIERVLRTLARAPVRIGLSFLLTGWLAGGAMFSIFEPDASLIDGMYWATVVMPTVGFGDFSPTTVPGRWVYEWVVLFGRLGEILITGALVGAIAARRLEHAASTADPNDDLDDIKATVDRKIEGLRALMNHPRVKQALVEAHNERSTP